WPAAVRCRRLRKPTAKSLARCQGRQRRPCMGQGGEGPMGDSSRQVHWENVYTTKGETEVSWFQQSPAPSLELIVQAGAVSHSAIIDLGCGASRLVDHLIGQGFEDVTVLDLSGAALAAAKTRLESHLGASAK